MRACRLAAATAVVVLLALPSPVLANAGGHVNVGENAVDSIARNEETRQPSPKRSSRRKSACKWTLMEPAMAAELQAGGGYSEADGIWAEPEWIPPAAPGDWYWVDCAWGERTPRFVRDRAAVSPARLAHQAQRRLDLEPPVIELRPGEQAMHYVHSQTLLGIGDWEPRQSAVSVPGVTVTVDAVPQRLVWRIEDGTYDSSGAANTFPVECAGPPSALKESAGAVGAKAACEHTWTRPSSISRDGKFGLTAVVQYRVTWTVDGAPGGGDLGLVESAPAHVRVVVSEIQTGYRTTRQ